MIATPADIGAEGFAPGTISAWDVERDSGLIRLDTGESLRVMGALSDWQVSCTPFVGQAVTVRIDTHDGQRIVRIRSVE